MQSLNIIIVLLLLVILCAGYFSPKSLEVFTTPSFIITTLASSIPGVMFLVWIVFLAKPIEGSGLGFVIALMAALIQLFIGALLGIFLPSAESLVMRFTWVFFASVAIGLIAVLN